ncbi:hypothetical protein BDV25DRAFT_144567 [Aspergillus avenaceus]|uniref:Uncharacterized protein n=1 Tax=Aspergillus avenaceus TaxID=36643 RepID=A0A5N6THC9_ASPAV|nr:hypothetical protein BDV25DRAFT_144567 [Aspergillus avenaceus]
MSRPGWKARSVVYIKEPWTEYPPADLVQKLGARYILSSTCVQEPTATFEPVIPIPHTMNKTALVEALAGVLGATSLLRSGAQYPSNNTSVHGLAGNQTLGNVGAVNCTQACVLAGFACVTAIPNDANYWYAASDI